MNTPPRSRQTSLVRSYCEQFTRSLRPSEVVSGLNSTHPMSETAVDQNLHHCRPIRPTRAQQDHSRKNEVTSPTLRAHSNADGLSTETVSSTFAGSHHLKPLTAASQGEHRDEVQKHEVHEDLQCPQNPRPHRGRTPARKTRIC